MHKQDAYKLAIDARQLEIQLFWQRSNYFLALTSAIAIGFFTLLPSPFAFVLAVLGCVVSFLWYLTNLGSKYWQSRWEEAAARLERECFPDVNLFSATPAFIAGEVEKSLSTNGHAGFQRWIDSQIRKKPSVSYQMIRLSALFFVFWCLMIVFLVASS